MVPEYDALASVYADWSRADPAAAPCRAFYAELYRQCSGRIIELGVGNGCTALAALEAGHRITGVDISRRMLDDCRQLAEQSDLSDLLTLSLQDARSFSLPYRADLITCPFRTFGHFLTPQSRLDVLRCVHAHLEPGGHFIFDHYAWDEAWARRHDGVRRLMVDKQAGAERVLVWDTYNYDFEAQRMDCIITIRRVNSQGEAIHSSENPLSFSWIYPDQVRALAYEADLVVENLYGDFSRGGFDQDSTEQIWVLRRPGRSAHSGS